MNPFVFGLSATLLIWTLSFACNCFAKFTEGSAISFPGLLILVLVGTLITLAYACWWTRKTSVVFYAAFFPNFLWGFFDMLTFIELYTSQSFGFLSEYLGIDEPIVHNLWMFGIISFDATVLVAANYVVLFLLSKGRSVRNWLLFFSSYYGFVGIVWGAVAFLSGFSKHPFTKLLFPVTLILPTVPLLLAFNEPESVLEKNYAKLRKNSTLGNIAKCLQIVSVAIILCKILILLGNDLEFFKSHDYTLNLLNLQSSRLLIQVQIISYGILCLPCVLLSIVSLSGKWIPSFLWDLSVIQVGTLASGHVISILSVLFWEMPPELKGNPWDLAFWAINLIPVAAALLQVLYLAPYVSGAETVKKLK